MEVCGSVTDAEEVARLVETVHGRDDRLVEYAVQLVRSAPEFSIGLLSNGKLASWMVLVPTPLSIEGITVPCAQMGIVGTLPEVRNKGMCRKVSAHFDRVAHDRLGALVQIIGGIPHFYRRLDYHYALSYGWFLEATPDVVVAATATASKANVRAEQATTPAQLAEYARIRNECWGPLAQVRTADVDVAKLEQQRSSFSLQETCFCAEFWVLRSGSTDGGAIVGSFALNMEFGRIGANELWIAPEADVLACVAAVIACCAKRCGPNHIPAIREPLQPQVQAAALALCNGAKAFPRPYAWYCKIPDLVALLDTLRPALTRRLQAAPALPDSVLVLHSYDIAGIHARLTIAHNTVVSVERAESREGNPDHLDLKLGGAVSRAGTGLPEILCFCPDAATNLVLGRRTIDELPDIWPDTAMSAGAEILCRYLFPRMAADVSLCF